LNNNKEDRLNTYDELAQRRIQLKTAVPGPIGRAQIQENIGFQSPSLIHVYPLMVARAAGCMVEDVDGNVLLDAQAGVAAASTGHAHPELVDAISKQAATLIHICGTDFHYPGYGQLCRRLEQHARALEAKVGRDVSDPAPRWQAFLTNSGTEAVEAAIKLARHHTGRSQLIAFRGGFHGRTMGSLSLTASKTKYRRRFGPLLPGVHHADYGSVRSIVEQLFGHTVAPDDVAAVVVEPVLGEGGYIVPDVAFLKELRTLCDQHGILLVFDEVQSGMGRTGTMFAAEHFSVVPDIFTLAKGLGSGMPIGAMLARTPIMTWGHGTHGSTCGGNPVAIAAALSTLDLLERNLIDNSRRVGSHLKDRLQSDLAGLPQVCEVRGLGLMIGIEFDSGARADAIAETCYKRGLLVLGCGERCIRISPPLILSPAQADWIADVFCSVVKAS
jgi:4-aminobutyrate aminotransferase